MKRYDFDVELDGQNEPFEFSLEKNVECIRSFAITSNKDNLLFYRGSLKLEIGGIEYLCEDYEAKLLICGTNIAPNRRRYIFRTPASPGNGILKVTYKDTSHESAAFSTYRVSIYVYYDIKA